jgi:hypothetical protein
MNSSGYEAIANATDDRRKKSLKSDQVLVILASRLL